MSSYTTLACSGSITFTFFLSPQVITPEMHKTGLTDLEIPGMKRPMSFDGVSQNRIITINCTLMSLQAYNAALPGTGTILDQIADLDIIAGKKGTLCALFVPYPENLSAGHEADAEIGPTAYLTQYVVGDNTRTFFGVVTDITVPFDVGGFVRQKATISFREVDSVTALA